MPHVEAQEYPSSPTTQPRVPVWKHVVVASKETFALEWPYKLLHVAALPKKSPHVVHI